MLLVGCVLPERNLCSDCASKAFWILRSSIFSSSKLGIRQIIERVKFFPKIIFFERIYRNSKACQNEIDLIVVNRYKFVHNIKNITVNHKR